MGVQDVIALSIAAVAALFAGRTVWRTINKGGCGGSCGCAGKQTTPVETPVSAPPGLARKPLVSVDQVGLPQRHN